MFNKYRCLGSIAVLCLSGLLIAGGAQASTAPAATSSVAEPYSPVVSFNTLPALQSTTLVPNSSHVPRDFDGDGTSDLLWFNPSLSQVGYWTMTATAGNDSQGSVVTRTGVRSFNVTPGYFVGASGDFNNDGFADLVFTSTNRDLWLWTNNQNGTWASTKIGTYPSQWQLVGAGDVDGDGYDDLLWLDPSDCQFAYWTMHGAVRTGSKIINVACGYYPVSIGYYSPSNRISILWTSSANDLYIWDSNGSGFNSYDLTAYFSYYLNQGATSGWAIGGGYMGSRLGFLTFGANNGFVTAEFNRVFDAQGNQTNVVRGSFGDGGIDGSPAPASYLFNAGNVASNGLFAIDASTSELTTGGLQPVDPPEYLQYQQWSYPAGWHVVGAPANNTVELPWK